jgi:hypothetical protein
MHSTHREFYMSNYTHCPFLLTEKKGLQGAKQNQKLITTMIAERLATGGKNSQPASSPPLVPKL